jgi:hypothetical protein
VELPVRFRFQGARIQKLPLLEFVFVAAAALLNPAAAAAAVTPRGVLWWTAIMRARTRIAFRNMASVKFAGP